MRNLELCAMNCHYRFYTLEEFFKSAHENGFTNVELWTAPQHFFLDYKQYDDISILQELEAAYDIKIIGICPEQTNPKPNNIAAKTIAQKERVYQYFTKAIDIASELKAQQVVVTSGWAYYDEDIQEAWNRSVTMMRQLANYASSKNMKLAIEALQKDESMLVNTVEDLKRYIDEVKQEALYVCLDFGAMAGANNTIHEYFDVFPNRILHCHFVDGNPVGHFAWGDGSRNMKQDLTILQEHGYKGYLSLESANNLYFKNPQAADLQSMKIFQKSKKEMQR